MNNTILIVDDVKLNIDALTDILSDKYKIMAAVSGENALKTMERKKPDLVLLDVSMPGIDGFEVMKFMKEHEELANIPVIFVTGASDAGAEEKGLKLGAVDYIKKPFNQAIIVAKVRNHIELSNYRNKLELLVYERTKQLEKRTKQLEGITKQLTASRNAVIMGMSLMSEIHDEVTGDHIDRIKIYTSILVDKLLELHPYLMKGDLAQQIVLYSPLHDVGKVGISDIILKKTGVLTPEEFNIMKRHTLDGAELLRRTEQFLVDEKNGENLQVAIEIAASHHEKFDGTGYPYGLKGEEIPLSARIVTIADIYDALRSPRSYKKAFTHGEALDIILLGDGRTSPNHFDPDILEAFSLVHSDFEKVWE